MNIFPRRFYFTFGYGHVPDIGHYTVIWALSERNARDKIMAVTRNWAFCYYSAKAAGVDEFNLIHVPLKKVRELHESVLEEKRLRR